MQHIRTLTIDGKLIEYTIRKRKKQKSYALAVHQGGRVTLTIPHWVSLFLAEKYISEKKEWLMSVFQKHPQKKFVSLSEQKKEYQTHKENARTFVQQRLEELNGSYGFEYKRIAIRRNTSRWGSCSQLKNLNFDYRILFLPAHLQDYLLVHELCHLQEMNHSKRFWELVAQSIPKYRIFRKELRRHVL